MGLFGWIRSKPAIQIPKLRLVVFGTEETLPWPLQLAHPGGLWGALLGMPRALKQRGDPRLLLEQSMEPGDYIFEGVHAVVAACVERRQPRDTYPDPESGQEDARFADIDAVIRDRLANARWMVALELTDVLGDTSQAVQFQVDLSDRLATLSEGVVLDQDARRYHLPGTRQLANAN